MTLIVDCEGEVDTNVLILGTCSSSSSMVIAEFFFFFVSIDEATSALDATTRILVFEALKQTTIMFTDNISQISPGDFVYILKYGWVVEQGSRADFKMGCGEGECVEREFRTMVKS
jgi:hypothetical protein